MEAITSFNSHRVGNSKGKFIAVEVEIFNRLVENINILTNEVKSMRTLHKGVALIYDNKKIKELLCVNDKLLKKYRDNGLLPFTQVGDKYWYTQQDVQTFLSSSYYPAFATAS